jgi:uncharacterized protein (TIGR00369 family)
VVTALKQMDADPVQYMPPGPDATDQELVDWANALPLARQLHIVCVALNRSEATFRVDETLLPPNPNGAIHGGVVSAIADQCLGVVSVINAPRDLMSVTASLHGQYHRPAVPPLIFRSRLISAGRRLIFVEVEVEDALGRRCATFQATMVVGGAERRSS